MYEKKKKAAVQTGLEFFSPAVLPFLHFLSACGEKKSHSYEAQWSNLALKQSDNEHSISAGHFEKAERGTWFVHLFPELRYDGERHTGAKDLSSSRPMGIKPRSGLALSHPPNRCQEWATWSKNAFLFFCAESRVFFQELPQDCGTRSWKGSLGCQPVLSPKETGQSDCHLPQPSGRRKLLSKNMFLLGIFHPLWESHKDPG